MLTRKISNKLSDLAKDGSPVILQEDTRILRECLSWVYKHTPVMIQKKVNDELLRFANNVKEYCPCGEKAYIASEKKFACLDCGKRHKNALGDPRLVSI